MYSFTNVFTHKHSKHLALHLHAGGRLRSAGVCRRCRLLRLTVPVAGHVFSVCGGGRGWGDIVLLVVVIAVLMVVVADSESSVRVASALTICSRLGWPAVGGSGRFLRSGDVCERGGPCPAMWARSTFVSRLSQLFGIS